MASNTLPSKKLTNLLEQTRLQSWIVSHVTQHAPSSGELKRLLGGLCPSRSSRTHKKAAGQYWSVQVQAQADTCVGVDLEYLSDDFLKRDHPMALQLLDLPSDSSPQDLLVEWSSREAAYKAIQQSHAKNQIEIRELKRINRNFSSIVTGPRAIRCEVTTVCDGRWVLSIAKLNSCEHLQMEGA